MKLVFVLSLFFFLFKAHAEESISVGVLEQTQDDVEGAKPYFTIRAVFKKQNGTWQTFPYDCAEGPCLKKLIADYPKEALWTIAFDGKKLGTITTTAPSKFRYYSGIGRLEIKDQASVPKIGKPTLEFVGWDGKAYYRPLVSVSKANYLDPDNWKPSQASLEVTERLKSQFKKLHPQCECSEFDDIEPPCKSAAYKNTAIKIGKSYSSKRDWRLVTVELSCGKRLQSVSQLYAVSKVNGKAPIEIRGRLIDAGDYDGDGKSELLFKTVGYNEGGYTLYFNDFSDHIDFKFGYH